MASAPNVHGMFWFKSTVTSLPAGAPVNPSILAMPTGTKNPRPPLGSLDGREATAVSSSDVIAVAAKVLFKTV